MKRANACLALYYQPEDDPDTKLAVRQAFVRALEHVPQWAMLRAFDAWDKSSNRRPTPAEIVILAERELIPFVAELKRRREAAQPQEPRREPPSPEAAAAILEAAGFTAKRMEAVRAAPMASTFAEAEAKASGQGNRHWSETADPDSPEWRALRAARAANALVKPPRQDAAE